MFALAPMRFSALALLLLAGRAAAQPEQPDGLVEALLVEGGGAVVEGRLDWAAGTLSVTGQGAAPEGVTNPVQRRLLGFRAAKVDAYRALLEAVGGVQVDGHTTVSMSMVASDSVRTRVEGLVRGARVVPGSQRQENDLYRLDLRLDLRGPFADAVLPPAPGAAASPLPAALPAQDSLLVFTPPRPHTGLVVDARGTGLRPSLSPRIVDDGGRVVYAADHVDRQYAVRTGVAGYYRGLGAAAASDRVGGANGNPMVVQAAAASGLYHGDAVVTGDQGTRILMADLEGEFLSQCRVVFVVGPRPEPAPEAPPWDFLDSLLQGRGSAAAGAAGGAR